MAEYYLDPPDDDVDFDQQYYDDWANDKCDRDKGN